MYKFAWNLHHLHIISEFYNVNWSFNICMSQQDPIPNSHSSIGWNDNNWGEMMKIQSNIYK